MGKLTPAQRAVLARLNALGCNALGGFNPCSFGGPKAAVIARRLNARGLVAMRRLSDFHIRYEITTSGRSALQQGGSE